jgi:hypothetical protein
VLSKKSSITNTNNANGATNTTNQSVANANVASNTNTTPLNSNSATQPANHNVNTVGSSTTLYQGDGFSLVYPSTWSLVRPANAAPRLTPTGTTFSLEGTADYPINITVIQQTADAYVSALPAANKTAVTFNAHPGYKGYTLSGHAPFYVFTLADGRRSVVIGFNGTQLEQTSGPAVTTTTLEQVFEQVARSLQTP